MSISPDFLRQIVEGALMAAGKPLSISDLQKLFDEDSKPSKAEFEAAFEDIQTDCQERGFELKEIASGWRFQVKQDLANWVGRLWEEKPQKYSRALLETLALIAYRQPITRGEIEEIRGVAVSSQIIKTLLERNWVKVVGHRDVPGRPSMYATTREFLDYFNLKSLEELPTLAEIRDLDTLNQELNLDIPAEVLDEMKAKDPDAEVEAEQDLLSGDEEQPEPASDPEAELEEHSTASIVSDEDAETELLAEAGESIEEAEGSVEQDNDTDFETEQSAQDAEEPEEPEEPEETTTDKLEVEDSDVEDHVDSPFDDEDDELAAAIAEERNDLD